MASATSMGRVDDINDAPFLRSHLRWLGSSIVDLATDHWIICALVLSLSAVALATRVFYLEWQAEFGARSAQYEATTLSWVMGLVIIILFASTWPWWSQVPPRSTLLQRGTDSRLSLASSDATIQSSSSQSQPSVAVSTNGQPQTTTADIGLIADLFDSGKALEMLYGDYDKQLGTAKWEVVNPPEQEFEAFRNIPGARVRAAFQADYQEDGERKVFLLTSAVPDSQNDYSCHACRPLIGATIFVKVDNQWKVEASEKYLMEGDGFGKVPDTQLVQIGPDKFGLRLSSSDMAQGFESGGQSIIALVKDRITVVFEHITLDDSCGAVEIEFFALRRRQRLISCRGQTRRTFPISKWCLRAPKPVLPEQ